MMKIFPRGLLWYRRWNTNDDVEDDDYADYDDDNDDNNVARKM